LSINFGDKLWERWKEGDGRREDGRGGGKRKDEGKDGSGSSFID